MNADLWSNSPGQIVVDRLDVHHPDDRQSGCDWSFWTLEGRHLVPSNLPVPVTPRKARDQNGDYFVLVPSPVSPTEPRALAYLPPDHLRSGVVPRGYLKMSLGKICGCCGAVGWTGDARAYGVEMASKAFATSWTWERRSSGERWLDSQWGIRQSRFLSVHVSLRGVLVEGSLLGQGYRCARR